MRKRVFEIVAIVGALMTIQSIFWEHVRMKPDYRFLVDPWSIRGYESVHGFVFATIGVALLLATLAVMWKKAEDPIIGPLIVAGVVAAAVVIAAVFDGRDPVVTFNFFVVILLALFGAVVSYRLIRDYVAPRYAFFRSGVGIVASFLGPLIALELILMATIGGTSIDLPLPVAVLVVMLILAVLALTAQPRELAASRMLLFSTFVAGAAIGTSAGALRSTLRRLQEIPAEYKDIQVTWGYFLANIGVVLVFIGALAMWAKRRDRIMTAQRARRQREAAEESAREIREALERSRGRSG